MRPAFLWLRRGLVLKAAVALAGVEVLAVLSRGTPWLGEWAWTIDWVNGATILSGPLLAGIVAYDTRSLGKPEWTRLAGGARRGPAVPLHVTAAAWGGATLIHLAVLVICIGVTARTDPTGSLPLLPIFLGPIVLAAFAALGLAVGTMFPSLLSTPVAIVVAFGLTYLGAAGTVPEVFRVGGVTGSLVGQVPDLPVLAIIVGFLVCFSVGVVVGVAYRQAVVLRKTSLALGALAIVGAAGAYVTLEAIGDNRYQLAASPPDYVCAGNAPKVCMAKGTTRSLPSLSREMARQAAIVRSLGVSLPEKYVQEVPGFAPSTDSGIMYMYVESVNAARVDPSQVADYLSSPAPCQEFYAERPPELALTARSLVADLIRDRTGVQAFSVEPGSEVAQWVASDEANVWMRDTFKELKECHLDAIRLPF